MLNATVLYLANPVVSPKPDDSSFTLLKSLSGAGPRALRAKTIIAYLNPNMNSSANAVGQQDGGILGLLSADGVSAEALTVGDTTLSDARWAGVPPT